VPKSQAEKRKLKEFGGNVRRERVARKLTQEKLAEKCSLNPRTIQKIEAGDIAILVFTLIRLQAALGCSWSALLGPEAKALRAP
jgi:transcriptional regulator with XRE-family HTH domain